MKYDLNQVDTHIWVGGMDSLPYAHQFKPAFSTLVLCAREIQPPIYHFKGRVLRPGFDDRQPITPEEVVRAIDAANAVIAEASKGNCSLVTCAMGWNRSALVAGFAMLGVNPTLSGDDVISLIRERRSSDALCNDYFATLIRAAGIQRQQR